jgi:glyoxylase-like metal-dependent hydrolase (beta-lactamase superfamily II)
MANDACQASRIERGGLVLHVFTSPEVGEMVNSLVIETPNALVVVDVPLYQPFADEFRAYLDGLGKPVERILVTHAHPDHWLTLASFQDKPTYAFREAIDEMAFLKDLAVGYHTSIHPDLVPHEVVLPANTIEPGPLVVDGVELVLHKLLDAEATATMLVEIPSIKTLLANDLVYDRCYLYVATRKADGSSTVDSWIDALHAFKARDLELIVPGHGSPSGPEIFDANIAYLEYAREVLATAADGPELVRRFKERYPDHRLELTLTMSAVMLYPQASA